MLKAREKALIIRQTEISENVFDMLIEAPETCAHAVPGQFVNVFVNDPARLMPRPVSICEITQGAGGRSCLRLVYRISGGGTAELSRMRPGDSLNIIGPLGNGFPLGEACGKAVFLAGGGIGVPPLLETAKQLSGKADVTAVLGYRHDRFLENDFGKVCRISEATEDGSFGVKGTVIDALDACGVIPDVIFACGPRPMLGALKSWSAKREIPLWVSMEERMACGIGACLACVCRTVSEDGHSHVKNTRVCCDGPVFNARDIVI